MVRMSENRKILGPLLLAMAIAASRASAQQPIDQRRPAARDGTVKITNAVGALEVIGWDRDTVAISGTLGAGAERLEFNTSERETRIRVVLRAGSGELEGSRLRIHIPAGSHLAVRTSAADIEVRDVTGAVDLESVSGSIRVSGSSSRMVYAESAVGNVELDVSSKVVRAKSVGGDVTVRRAMGYLEVSTVSGAAWVEGRSVWEGEITSVSGDIHFAGDFSPEGSFYFESHSGAIELLLPADVAADFEISTLRGGSVENDFAPHRDRSFSTGGGGTQVKVKSFKGQVRVRKR